MKPLFFLLVAVTCIHIRQASAQPITTLYNFSTLPTQGTNNDGAYPYGNLIVSGNVLYGTTGAGGSVGQGTLFAINTNGVGFTNLHTFTGSTSDGGSPYCGLALAGNTLYGTTSAGAASGGGGIFGISTNGTNFMLLYSFSPLSSGTNADGYSPYSGVVVSGNTLYGTAISGGLAGNGTVFSVGINGTSFSTLYSFSATQNGTNSDGAVPLAGLILSGSALYGTADKGGTAGYGTVFSISTKGINPFSTLHSFVGSPNEGAYPYSGALVAIGNRLYGTTTVGGAFGVGTVYALNNDGSGFTTLYSFTGGNDGGVPYGSLIVSGSSLYGTANSGGSSLSGTVFAINTNGTSFRVLYTFSGGADGANPYGGLISSGNSLFGTANGGGAWGSGTLFSLLAQPLLSITAAGTNVILTWPTNTAGFSLQFATNLAAPYFWSNASPTPVIVKGQNTVTNRLSGTQKLYRLIY